MPCVVGTRRWATAHQLPVVLPLVVGLLDRVWVAVDVCSGRSALLRWVLCW